MIIVEGPDGAGKTRVAATLAEKFGLPIAPRVVASNTEAMVDLVKWTEQNLAQGFQRMVFDRHRLISDPIYQAVLPWRPDNSTFYDPVWFLDRVGEFHEIDPIIIYCLPPKKVVLANVALEETDNSAILEHAAKIYDAYVAKASFDQATMSALTYDYAEEDEMFPEPWYLTWVEVQLKRRGHR